MVDGAAGDIEAVEVAGSLLLQPTMDPETKARSATVVHMELHRFNRALAIMNPTFPYDFLSEAGFQRLRNAVMASGVACSNSFSRSA